MRPSSVTRDRKSTRLNFSHTDISSLSLHDALPISDHFVLPFHQHHFDFFGFAQDIAGIVIQNAPVFRDQRSEEHTSELQSHRYLLSFPPRRSSDLRPFCLAVPSAPF